MNSKVKAAPNDVTVSLNAADALSGVAATYYTLEARRAAGRHASDRTVPLRLAAHNGSDDLREQPAGRSP